MSEIKYGLISDMDKSVLERTMDLICQEFPTDSLEVTEIGIYSGLTGYGIRQYFQKKGMAVWVLGIDNSQDGQEILYRPSAFIQGNSNEVYNQIEDDSQHMIIVDGNHSFPYVVADYYCYKDKVKVGGYFCFHDIKPECQGLDWQKMGDEKDSDMSIAVRRALIEVGLLHDNLPQWVKVFEEWDENDRCGGFAIFKKLY